MHWHLSTDLWLCKQLHLCCGISDLNAELYILHITIYSNNNVNQSLKNSLRTCKNMMPEMYTEWPESSCMKICLQHQLFSIWQLYWSTQLLIVSASDTISFYFHKKDLRLDYSKNTRNGSGSRSRRLQRWLENGSGSGSRRLQRWLENGSSAVAKMCKSTELFNMWIKASKFAQR